MLGKSSALPFLFLVLIKGMGGVYLEVVTGGFYKKYVLENFSIFTGKHPCWSVFNSTSGFVKMKLHHRGFLVNVVKSLRAPILKIISEWLVLCVQEFLG